MVDSCTVTRVTGQVLSESTGEYEDTVETVYEGACRVQLRNFAVASLPLSGERQVVALQLEVSLPVATTGVAVGDLVTMTAAPNDAQLVGRAFRVREEMHKTHATARRLVVQEEQT